ncbi:MAG: ATP-dependent helicase [Candidatus Babeliaceae bacterium]|nr:ATP-dependent helicase [Candidatus Babeliaceae bacterium]
MSYPFSFLDGLNDEQCAAVMRDKNTLVIAGPGSGKTRIVTAKAALELANGNGVACLSFSNAASDRIRDELISMRVPDSDDLFTGTVHDFCLTHIIYPFSPLFGDRLPENFGIASEKQSVEILIPLLHEHGESGKREAEIVSHAEKCLMRLTSLRRDVVVNGWPSSLENLHRVLLAYDQAMFERGLLDFEMIVQRAIEILRDSVFLHRYLRHRFAWLLIDEYQDLGGSLHTLAMFIAEKIGMKILAVGDPDQLIYGFVGANEVYMYDLLKKGLGFEAAIKTKKCYRFGDRIIATTETILAQPRDFSCGRENPGEDQIHFVPLPGGSLSNQTDWIVHDLLPTLQHKLEQRGKDISRIAILYRSKGPVVNCLRQSLNNPTINRAGLEFVDERIAKLPNSPFINWLRQCAGWAIEHTRDLDTFNRFPTLFQDYLKILRDAKRSYSELDQPLIEREFRSILLKYDDPTFSVQDWIRSFCEGLELYEILDEIGNRTGDLSNLDEICQGDVASNCIDSVTFGAVKNKAILTTMHSSKGREFDYVILPAISSVEPWGNPDAATKRLFYVACTRAREAVYITYSERNPSPLVIKMMHVNHMKSEA